MRLHSRIYLHSLLVLLVVGAATSLIFALVNRGMLMRDMGERMARHAAGLVAERLHDPPALARRLERLHAELDVDVAVRDLDGGVLAGAGEALPRPSAPTLAAVRGGQALVRGRPPHALAPVRDELLPPALGVDMLLPPPVPVLPAIDAPLPPPWPPPLVWRPYMRAARMKLTTS